MEHSKTGALPMRHGIKLSKKQSPKTDEELKRMSDIPYASDVGSIQYVVQCTRPDVAYALSVTSRYQACAGEAHWSTVKNILKYLRRTKDMFLIYSGGELILSKQDTIADSTTEAEYIVASEAAKEAVWMKNYIQELGVVPSIAEPVVVFCDNNGAIAQARNRVRVCSEDGEFQEEDPSPVITWQWYLLCAWRYVVLWKSCGHSRCPNRIGSYVEQLGTTWSQVLSIAVWSRMRTDAQFHTLDRGRETVDGRTLPIQTRGLNVHATFHLVTMCHGPLLEGHPWSQARRSRAQSTRELAGSPTSSLGASSLAHWLAGRELARCELARSRADPARRPRARRVRARADRKQDLVAGCELAGSRPRQPADSWKRNCWRFSGGKVLLARITFGKDLANHSSFGMRRLTL
ncbi:UNVERIFIED_CONTAM: Retrovirus-related Pol polyprotein from transposon TNT 1-94 [Sesamum radiatum]|uniref:Retrovirus-related Pol polyprotein from transposon TNT 1-94 n=1 Tax=Sesamum radiatum TaxID=300843 RepID=A0AAW2T6B0_SESRA